MLFLPAAPAKPPDPDLSPQERSLPLCRPGSPSSERQAVHPGLDDGLGGWGRLLSEQRAARRV